MLNKNTLLLALSFFLSINIAIASDHSTIRSVQHMQDFDALLKQSKKENKVILIEMSASYCGFCKQLEAEIINPMIISGDYEDVIIRQVEVDSYYDIKMPNNQKISPSQFAASHNIFVTPTLIFLNHKNEEVSERIIGINTVEYFSAYVDAALKEGAGKLQ